MEQNLVQKLISLLPAGEKRDALMRKMNSVVRRKENKDGGLQDEFSFKPKGHIMIEEIDKDGQVLGVLADQPNLVVKGSEEILLRAFSGDPKRILYKNRKIKEYKNNSGTMVDGISKSYNTPVEEITTVLNGEDVVPFHQNELWKAVNDEDFEIEYSYYPNTLYVKAEALPLEPNMTTFKVYSKSNAPAGAAPLQAEIYSNYSNMFIGLGDGVNKRISFDDERFNYNGFTQEGNTLVGKAANSRIEFSSKITNVKIVAEGEGSIEVVAAGSLRGEYNLTVIEGEKEIEIVGLDSEIITDVVITMTAGANIVIKEIAFDEFSINDNALMHEFENFTLRYDTPTIYNTNDEKGPNGTYITQLNNFPINAETLKVTYDGESLEVVEDLLDLEHNKYFLEPDTGIVHFSEPLTGLLISYNITKEIHEDEPTTSLTTDSTSIVRKTIANSSVVTLTNQLDGSKTSFDLGFKLIQNPSTVVVELDGVAQSEGTHYTLNAEEGTLELIPVVIPGREAVAAVPPTYDEDGSTILDEGSPAVAAVPEKIIIPNRNMNSLVVRSFKYEKHTPAALNTFVMGLNFEVKDHEIRVQDQTGENLQFVETEEELLEGRFTLRENDLGKIQELVIVKENEDLELITKVEVYYVSDNKPGEVTNYTRQVIEKPKEKNQYPWFQLDKGKIVFVAEFPEDSPNHNVTIREMGLFDGPRIEDGVRGFNNYNVKAFSLVRVGETRKEATTGLRVTWTITLLNEEGVPFKGGL